MRLQFLFSISLDLKTSPRRTFSNSYQTVVLFLLDNKQPSTDSAQLHKICVYNTVTNELLSF